MTTLFFSIITLLLSVGTQSFGQNGKTDIPVDRNSIMPISDTEAADYIPREYLRQMNTKQIEIKDDSIPSGFQKPEYQPFYHPTLSQIPAEERTMIKKIVSKFSLDKQKVMVQLRPAQEQTVYQRDTFRIELSSLLENDVTTNDKKQIQELINKIREREQELVNLQTAEKHNIEILRRQMYKEITKVINNWLVKQVTVTEEFLAPLIYEAEKNYDYISEIK